MNNYNNLIIIPYFCPNSRQRKSDLQRSKTTLIMKLHK